MSSALINIAIVSDSICPFCYLGYKKLLVAIDAFKKQSPSTEFALEFRPFLLDPSLPTDHGENKRERYIKKFGGAERVAAMEQTMYNNGLPYGIKFSYEGNVRQTTDSHRIIAKAYQKGGESTQRAVVEKLFKGYFEEAKDPAEPNWLAEQAEAAGVGSKEDMLAFLRSDEEKQEVAKGIQEAQELGISGVPFFIMNKKGEEAKRYGLSGAQDPETIQQVFSKVIA